MRDFGIVQQFEHPFRQVPLPEVLLPIFIWMHFDYGLFEEGLDIFWLQHIRKGDLLPLRPYRMQGC